MPFDYFIMNVAIILVKSLNYNLCKKKYFSTFGEPFHMKKNCKNTLATIVSQYAKTIVVLL